MNVKPRLSTVVQNIQGGRLVQALSELLAVWQDLPAAELAEVLEALGAQIDRALPPVEGRSKSPALNQTWLDMAMPRRSADVGRLLARLEDASVRMLRGWLDQLADFPSDPRVPRAALRAALKFTSHEAKSIRSRAFKLAAQVGDGRLLAELASLVEVPATTASTAYHEDVAERIAKLRTQLSPPPAISTDDIAAIDAIRVLIAELGTQPAIEASALEPEPVAANSREEALLATIAADPSADEPRLVYADLLSERGDPRGEFILLQLKANGGALKAKDEQHANALAKEHGKRWIAPLDAVVRNPKFARGFLSECSVSFSTAKHEQLFEHRGWATVERIHDCNREEFFLSPTLRSLREASMTRTALARLATRPTPVPLTTVRVKVTPPDHLHPDWNTIGEVGSLRALRHLHLQFPHPILWGEGHGAIERPSASELSWFLDTELAQQLDSLHVFNGGTAIAVASWLPIFARLPNLSTVETSFTPADYYNSPNYNRPKHPCDVAWILRRQEDGLELTLALEWPFHRRGKGERERTELRPIGEPIQRSLIDIRKSGIDTVRLVCKGPKWTKAELARATEVVDILEPYFDRVDLLGRA